ncbi:putative cofactor assembly of complex C subunit B, CCB2/CCB4 [Helianthus annuus]|uniref:Cofactor assembly of complex C subunit B, CCB2/CCB4 n=1 Tax=Helianthus annuus TaxID=4232 RepID=A0A9K3NI78_HELAN|nr:protein COFACTOR ASSEMBLY OF COMPLEX C SUBUNIT B CCB2, chloroplastic [Helianthus annuus]XP_021974252.1 protein COFACTOR ASSEMBLY OF COMPLEX C SUBUNIT B CCB2, chloroplastic [Helianthus annuus]KAF5800483.1 putative cofactor assembly of complex C subunit B, CCB2/CCB4 [Helianthus annuus]
MSHTCTLFHTPITLSSIFTPKFRHKTTHFHYKNPKNPTKSSKITCTGTDNSQNQNQQLNLSVLRFTLGIPGLDESYLPRWIGYAFGSLLVLNHLASSNSTPAQLRTEVLGLSLAAFSVILPYIGQFLKGASPVVKASIPEGAEQIFAMSPDISDTSKEDLAWGSYTLLRNTNSISVLISVHDVLCVRGYWNTPKGMDLSKDRAVEWFKEQVQRVGLVKLTDTLYFPQRSDSELWEMLPEGTRSVLVLPVTKNRDEDGNSKDKSAGFVLLASSINYAYSNKDRAWIAAIAKKF